MNRNLSAAKPAFQWSVGHTLSLILALLPISTTSQAETLTLDECLRETVSHNPAVLQQTRDIERAAGTRLTLRSRALPTLAISGLLGEQGQGSDATLLVPGVDVTGKKVVTTVIQKRPSQFILIGSGALYQPIFDMAIPATWRRGNLETATAQENYYTVATTQLYVTRALFNAALFHRENGELLAGIDRALAANVKVVEPLVNAGLTGRQALLQAQTQRGNFASLLNATTDGYRTAVTALLASMGRDQRATGRDDLVTGIRLEGALDEAPFSFDSHAAAEHALSHRPDLEALRVLSRSYREDAKITRAGYFPTARVYVTGDLLPQSFQRSERNNALREGDEVRTTEIRPGVRYDWNVIDTGTVRGAAQAIDRTRESVDISLRQMEENIPRDLSRLRAQLQDAGATMNALRANVAAAEDTLNIVTGTVAQGTGTQIEFNSAQSELFSLRSSLLLARFSATTARTDFDRVAGNYLRFVTAARPGRTDSGDHVSK